ncbi:unnamed protein product [Clonostachys rosea f. rosea IK726]|uniref:aldehyde dehydrogenase (NAD(+)) n=2 Tax=Bionectria ochroleuca TaxID=29856 RepID=A0A0B7K0Y2_BIOOC|nr:unnamed protein product [Clonostachys rosea f. rosea IK726]
MTYASEIHAFHSGQTQPKSSSSSLKFTSIDPSTGKSLATIYTTTSEQLNDAMPRMLSNSERAAVLLRAAAILRERNDDLALVETLDTGKAWSKTSTVNIATGVDVLEYSAHFITDGIPGKHIKLRPDAYVSVTYEPLGVCAGIGAWNYPIQIALWKSAPCLAAGNSMIYTEAGLPPGVFNVVYGDGPTTGAPLIAHPGIAKVSFTGQVSTGNKAASQAARDLKSNTMELGGKSPLLILPDADVEEASDVAMMANFFSTGQVCTNGTRVFVPDVLLDQVEQALMKRCREGIRMGLPKEHDTNFGPVVSAMQQDKIISYIQHGREQDKAKVLYDGSIDAHFPTKEGFWVPPMIFTACADDIRICREEIFGPVMCYSTDGPEEEWLSKLAERANDTEFGLAAGVVASDIGLAQRVIQQLDAGITWINTWGESPAEMPVGGWKMSGIGLENGHERIQAYLQAKSTLVQCTKGACGGGFTVL